MLEIKKAKKKKITLGELISNNCIYIMLLNLIIVHFHGKHKVNVL